MCGRLHLQDRIIGTHEVVCGVLAGLLDLVPGVHDLNYIKQFFMRIVRRSEKNTYRNIATM